jgi:hypothetical protein
MLVGILGSNERGLDEVVQRHKPHHGRMPQSPLEWPRTLRGFRGFLVSQRLPGMPFVI